MRYGFIEDNRKRWSVREQCLILGVGESGYYRYLKGKGKPRKDELISVIMKEIMDEHPCNDNYGVQRMKIALEQRGIIAWTRRA